MPRTNHIIRVAVLLLSVLCYFEDEARGKDYYFNHYDKGTGLAQQTVYCSMQDRNGFMWFGTKAGLSRFDGENFKNYIYDEDNRYSIPSNIINSITEGPDGSLWLGTAKGLCRYDPVEDTFHEFECDEFEITIGIDHVAFDKQGNLWALNGSGVYFVSRNHEDNRFYPAGDYFWPTGITITQAGKVCILGNDGRLHILEASKGEVSSYQILTEDEIEQNISMFRVLEFSAGELLVTTSNAGARTLSLNTGEVTRLFTTDAEGNQIYIHCALQPYPGEFWFGSETGIHIFKLGTGFTDHLTKRYDSNYSLSDNAVHSLAIDRENGIWAGTFFGGLNYLSYDNTVFEKYLPRNKDNSIVANVIRSIQPDSKGNLWIGTEDGGLCRFNTSTKEFSVLSDLTWEGQPISRNIQGLLLHDDRYLWIGSFDRGIYILDVLSNQIIKHYSSEDPSSGLTSGLISFLYETSGGDVLVGTQNGLFVLDRHNDIFKVVGNMSFGFIHSLYEDPDHTLWIGCLGHGLYRTDALSLCPTSTVSNVPFVTGQITSVSSCSSDSSLWVSTEDSGLFRFDKESGKATSVLPKDTFPGIIIYQVIEDSMGTIWISSSDGLIRYNPLLNVYNRYTTVNGLPIDEFNYNSSYQDRTGNIYLGSLKGLVCFSPERLQLNHFAPKVYFTRFWIYDQDIETYPESSPLKKSILFTDKIDLKADQSVFSVQFAAPYYSISQNIWYRYRLNGLESEWKMTFGPQKLNYTKLPAGKYSLEVQASNNPDFWEPSYSSLDIVLHPTIWKTLFARIVYAMILCMLAYYIVSNIKKKIKRTEQAHIEKLTNEKEKEILESKLSFFTNITHEIRTPLTLIMGSLDRIAKRKEPVSPDDEDISVMSRNTGRLYDLVNQLLDFRKIESSFYYMQFAEVDLRLLLKDIYDRFAPAARNKGAEINLAVEDGSYDIIADKEALTKILSNMLSNALKFCEKRIDVFLSAANKESGDMVRIRINNDGNIIPQKEIDAVFKPFYQYKSEDILSSTKGSGLGLPLAKSLAEMHNGKLYFDSNITGMNSFVLDLPLSQQPAEEEHLTDNPVQNEIIREGDKALSGRQCQTILVVEDDEDLCRYLSEELSGQYSILTANNGEMALNVLDKNIVSLIISDIMMPVMDGIALIKAVRNNIKFCHIPIIVLTAKVSMQAHLDVLDSKADAFIEKPFSSEHLKAQIANLLANRDLMRSTIINSPYAHLSSVASNSKDEHFLEKMNDYVMKNLSNPSLSVESLADHMNMSQSTLFRKVKSTTSLSPIDFIRLCRLKKAAELLSTGERRVNEVAEEIGFTKASYFASCFMKQFGMSPGEFVKMSRNRNE